MLCVSSERESTLSLKYGWDIRVAWHFVETQKQDDSPVQGRVLSQDTPTTIPAAVFYLG